MQGRDQNYFSCGFGPRDSYKKSSNISEFKLKPLFWDELQYIYQLLPPQWSFSDTGQLLLPTKV